MAGRLLPLLALLTLCSCGTSSTPAPEPEPAETTPPVRGARIETAESEYAFGRMADGKEVSHTFRFTNTGDSDLVIEEVKTSCSCTAAELSKERYAPGEGDSLEVTWKPKGRGQQQQTVDLLSNAENAPLLRFRITAEVEPRLRIDPLAVDFGTVELGTSQQQTVRIVSTYPGVEIVDVRSISSAYEVLVRPVGQDGHLGNVDVTLLETAPPGAVNGTLLIDYRFLDEETHGLTQSTAYVALHAKVFGQLTLDPTAFYVGRVDPGGRVDCALRLTHKQGKPFAVTARMVRCTPDGLEVVTREVSPGVVEVVVRGPITNQAERINGLVEVVTDVPGEERFELPVLGIVRAE